MTLQYLPAFIRFANDDWSGINAFTFTAYSVAPTITTPGTPLNITGYSATGVLRARSGSQQLQALTGAVVDGPNGIFALMLPRTKTGYPPQPDTDADSLLLLRVTLIDPSDRYGTIGLAPVFVYG